MKILNLINKSEMLRMKNEEYKFKESYGITMISLVIMIVLLIILAGVTINLSLGENGIFNKAKYAKTLYANSQVFEEEQLNLLDKQMTDGNYLGNTSSNNELIKYLNENIFPDGMPLVPKMDSYECSVGKVSASSEDSDKRTVYKAFDKKYYFGDITVYSDLDNSWQATDNGENYIQFEFNKPVIVNNIQFIPSYTSVYGGVTLKQAQLLLSNDGENFIEASPIITYNNNINTVLEWQKIESSDKVNKYKYVRLYVNGSYTTSYGKYTTIKEMQIYGWFEK